MNVIYLLNSDFAMAGTGTTAYNAVKGIYRHKYLKKLIVREYRKTEIDDTLIIKPIPCGKMFPIILNGISHYLCKGFESQYYNNVLFDNLSLRHIEKCNILHTWNQPIKCIEKAKKLGAFIVKEAASSHPLTQSKIIESEFSKYKIKYELGKNALKRNLKDIELADKIFVCSKFVFDSYIDNGVQEDKLIKINYGVDLAKYTTKKDKKDDTFRAVFVGQIQLRKGVQYLLEAWHKLNLKNSELILRGRIHPDAKKIVEYYRGKINLSTPGHGDPANDYAKSDLFVFPSLEDGFGLVILEAMASGLPVITTKNTGGPDVIKDNKQGFITNIRDSHNLAKKIKYFYDNRNEIKRMGMNARKQAEKYSWHSYGENVVKAYEKIMER
jgi:glycosyltransferase involved in cell wall biosynthesis